MTKASELLRKIAEFLVFHHYVLCPHCAVPNVLSDEDSEQGGGNPVCWSCRQPFRYGPGEIQVYHPEP